VRRHPISSRIAMAPQESGGYRFGPGDVSQEISPMGWQGIIGEGHKEIQLPPVFARMTYREAC
jgi:hypothetical protein